MTLDQIFTDLDFDPGLISGGDLSVITPIDGTEIGAVQSDDPETTEAKITRSSSAFRICVANTRYDRSM